MPYLFTSESVSEGHPDKIADQISDALIDNFLAYDPQSKVACETLVTTGQVVLAGEVKSKTYLDVQDIAREVIREIGYTKAEYMFEANSCGILSAIHEQSADINQGVDRNAKQKSFEAKANAQGAGDQGMMFGYATRETENYMPLALDLAHKILQELSRTRRAGKEMKYLRPDAKSQVTIEYDDQNNPIRIDTIVVSTQHDPFDKDDKMLKQIHQDIIETIIPRVKKQVKPSIQKLFTDQINYLINPTGKFVIGGPHGDTGLTGRKIIVDTYGGKGAHGGGAFSGKDPSKVDRSAAYATRHIAKNLVAAGVCDEVLVQVSYTIGVAKHLRFVYQYLQYLEGGYDGRTNRACGGKTFRYASHAIEERLKLRNPIYSETAAYGHMGRKSEFKKKTFNKGKENEKTVNVELFTWEKLDYVDKIKKAFKIK
ncbi:MAG: methionine adenosyltransferase [Sphingobacterium sp.]|nr:methionine adenosyltransferase [Sphingobacterium sp.]